MITQRFRNAVNPLICAPTKNIQSSIGYLRRSDLILNNSVFFTFWREHAKCGKSRRYRKKERTRTHMTYIQQAGNLSPDKFGVGPEESSSLCILNPDSSESSNRKLEKKNMFFFRPASSSRSWCQTCRTQDDKYLLGER